jgi:hypothetical protein
VVIVAAMKPSRLSKSIETIPLMALIDIYVPMYRISYFLACCLFKGLFSAYQPFITKND